MYKVGGGALESKTEFGKYFQVSQGFQRGALGLVTLEGLPRVSGRAELLLRRCGVRLPRFKSRARRPCPIIGLVPALSLRAVQSKGVPESTGLPLVPRTDVRGARGTACWGGRGCGGTRTRISSTSRTPLPRNLRSRFLLPKQRSQAR